ncbi:MAG TPA: electron transfer flavoprotein subunit beta/FixA family protein [Thermoanaerobaculia bacterium]|nr:electron transfer flavoprotein subunit beta/FixA family protein [Thermoanaerobaculia bacterium]
MNSFVAIAYVPDTETRIKISSEGKSIDESDVKWIVSPYDEYALEEALRTKEAKGAGTVRVVTVGPDRAKAGLRECLARGADEAVFVDTGDSRYLDAFGTAKALAAVAKESSYDFLWFGQKGVGYDESLVGPMVAELLDLPHVGNVIKLEVGEGKITAHREIEGAHEIVESTLPVVLTAQKGLNEPRYASLKGIMGAKKKPIAEKKLADLGIPEADPANAKVRWRKLELPPARQAVKLIPADDPAAAAKELVRLLREEAKVI